ncbi:hypothetical protein Fmac_015632 [Flemingia macrophylla]|uniref:Uncharacterized protein n=1 Tax=Flemingia macrophylla TaxID=520843 RepID=A0ABD1MF32_9FABA
MKASRAFEHVDQVRLEGPCVVEPCINDSETILRPLANQLRPTIVSSWMEKKKALLSNNVERMKRLLDNLQKKLDEDEHNKLKNGLEVQEASNSEFVSLSPGDQTTIEFKKYRTLGLEFYKSELSFPLDSAPIYSGRVACDEAG